MALIKTDFYNQIPKEMLPKMPEDGTVVLYELIVNQTELERDSVHKDRVQPLPSSVWIPCTSTAYNPANGEYIPIALIKNKLANGDVDFYRREIRPNVDGLYLTITIGSSAANNDLYQYLELCSFVLADGKVVSPNGTKLFKKVESQKEAMKARDARNKRKEAMIHATSLDSLGVNRAALLLGFYSSTTEEDITRERIEDFAEKKPDEYFDRVVNDTHGNTKATILHAIHLGVVKVQDNAIVWADSKAAICTLSSNTDPDIQFANWVHESPENLKTYGIIEDVIAKKIAKKAPKKA